MIIIKKLCMEFGDNKIFNNINLNIGNIDKVGLVGVNGAGKSTLLKILAGKVLQTSGTVNYSGKFKNVGYMPQVITELDLPLELSVFDFIISGRPIKELEDKLHEIYKQMESEELGKDEAKLNKLLKEVSDIQARMEYWDIYNAENEALKIIIGMNMDGIDLDEKIKNLSGGQKSKVAFARTLYAKPNILLLDEPTNHLDKASRKWMMEFFKGYEGSILAISHDIEFLDYFTNKTLNIDELTKSAKLYNGNYSQYIKQKEFNELTQNREFKNQEKEKERLTEFINRLSGTSGKKKRQAKSREKALEKLEKNSVERVKESKKMALKLVVNKESGMIPVKLEDIMFAYKEGKNILENVNFSLNKGEKFVIVGRNGAGKSTLLKVIVGQLLQQKGNVLFDRNTEIGYYSQEHEDLDLEATVLDEMKRGQGCTLRQLRGFLANFIFTGDKVNQKIDTLSPGERSRLALAKLAHKGANLILLDEPTNHLDPNTKKIIADVFRTYTGTMAIVSHDIDFLEQLNVERMLMLPTGQIKPYDKDAVRVYQQEELARIDEYSSNTHKLQRETQNNEKKKK
ncbi:MAG: hypothetical protein A2Y22_02585 [Clostridiales bacterium GWD2_32_59]|nr:MAG: hypothetical protein A2Y22_02585 [Clostridiales bacterium GWD2_32_59]